MDSQSAIPNLVAGLIIMFTLLFALSSSTDLSALPRPILLWRYFRWWIFRRLFLRQPSVCQNAILGMHGMSIDSGNFRSLGVSAFPLRLTRTINLTTSLC